VVFLKISKYVAVLSVVLAVYMATSIVLSALYMPSTSRSSVIVIAGFLFIALSPVLQLWLFGNAIKAELKKQLGQSGRLFLYVVSLLLADIAIIISINSL